MADDPAGIERLWRWRDEYGGEAWWADSSVPHYLREVRSAPGDFVPGLSVWLAFALLAAPAFS